ncbi:MAG: HDOD domain-containing protein [Verrucomicrobia bacterium]|nr:HDOD domain-containing protein [Verrucomicrobiota bacterium]
MDNGPIAYEQRMLRVRDCVDQMPALSTTVTKVLEICNHPNTSPNDLNKIISLDPVLTSRVLKLINSAYYSLPDRIPTLTRAIIMLGMNTVKNLALSTAVLGAMQGRKSERVLRTDLFWAHSLGVGVTAKALAMKRNVLPAEREDYFVAGLLHDLGKIPLVECFADEYATVLRQSQERQIPLCRAEQEVFGFDHGCVGRMIAEKWKLSRTIVECLSFHHELEKAAPDVFALVAVIELANIYCNTHKIGAAGDTHPETSLLPQILQKLNLAPQVMTEIEKTVLEEVEKAKAFINLS